MRKLYLTLFMVATLIFFSTNCQAQTQTTYMGAVDSYNKGDIQNARQQFEEVVRTFPDNADAQGYLGLTCYKLGDYNAAIKAFKEVIRLKPYDLSPYYNLGLAYFHNKNYNEAEAAFDVAQKYYGDNPDILYYDAKAHYDEGELDEVIKNLKTLVKKFPDYSIDSHYLLALAYYYKGMADDAAAQFNNVTKIAPDYTNWDKQARVYIAQIEQAKAARFKELAFSLYANIEHDSNVSYTSSPTPADADRKMTIFGSVSYRPILGGAQNLKLGYYFYNLDYYTHTSSNLLGNLGEISYNIFPSSGSLLALKTNLNMYNMAGVPYLFNLPIDCRLTFKFLPWTGAWSIAYIGYALDYYFQQTYKKQSANSVIIGLKQFINDSLSIGYEGKILGAQGSESGGKVTDDYSYQSHQANFSYIQLLPGAFSLSVDGSYSLKQYINFDSYTISKNPTKRSDNLIALSAVLSKTIFWEIGLMLRAGCLLDICNLTASQSALGYGSYSSSTFSLGAAKSF